MNKNIFKAGAHSSHFWVTLNITPRMLRRKPARYWASIINGKGQKNGVGKVFKALAKIIGYEFCNTDLKLQHYSTMTPSITVYGADVIELILRKSGNELKINRKIGRCERFSKEDIQAIENFMYTNK
jgi:hypothetical protein